MLAGLLAILVGAAHGASQPKRVAFQRYPQCDRHEGLEDRHRIHRERTSDVGALERERTVTLRSARPTTVLVTLGRGRVSYSPAVAGYVRAGLSQGGSTTTSVLAPCKERNDGLAVHSPAT